MSTPSVSTSKTNYPHKTATPKELQECRDTLGQLVAKHLQEMSAEQETIVKEYKNDKTLLDKGKWYPLDYVDALKSLGAAGKARIDWLREKEHLSKGFLDAKAFTPLVINEKRRHWEFLQKKDLLPSDALKAARVSWGILDCGAMVQLARYLALDEFLGAEKFNRLFKDKLQIGFDDESLQPMRFFVGFTSAAKNGKKSKIGKRPIEEGQVVSMNGVTTYKEKHPSGMGSNYNVVCLDATPNKQTFVGHGLSSKGNTEEEICRMMIDEYNKDPDYFTRASASDLENEKKVANYAERHKDKKKNPSEWKTLEGYHAHSPQDFNRELLYDLKAWPVDKVSLEKVSKHPKATKDEVVNFIDPDMKKMLAHMCHNLTI